MGMDFQYAGSASYPRFDREVCAVAEVFEGVKTEHLKNVWKQKVKDLVDIGLDF